MNKKLPCIASLLFTLAASAIAFAQAPPDFSGTWVLNTTKGQNLGMVAAIQETIVVTQSPLRLTMDIADIFQGTTTKRQVSYDLTGKPAQNENAMGAKSETVAKWDGGKLVVTWTSEGAVAGTTSVNIETRSLSADGRTMTVSTRRGENPPREMVFEKK